MGGGVTSGSEGKRTSAALALARQPLLSPRGHGSLLGQRGLRRWPRGALVALAAARLGMGMWRAVCNHRRAGHPVVWRYDWARQAYSRIVSTLNPSPPSSSKVRWELRERGAARLRDLAAPLWRPVRRPVGARPAPRPWHVHQYLGSDLDGAVGAREAGQGGRHPGCAPACSRCGSLRFAPRTAASAEVGRRGECNHSDFCRKSHGPRQHPPAATVMLTVIFNCFY